MSSQNRQTNRRPPDEADDSPWFAPRRYGIGAGRPIAWQGWAVLAVSLLAILGIARFAPNDTRTAVALVLVVAVSLGVIAFHRTKGGWRWRSGKD